VAVPLSLQDPLHLCGVLGLQQLDVPDWSPVRGRGLFGFDSAKG
jgi:hypothetical protein